MEKPRRAFVDKKGNRLDGDFEYDKDGKPIFREDGKVMKSDLYFKPDIKTILEKHVDLT